MAEEASETDPIKAARKRELIEFAMAVEGMGAAFAQYGADLTAELLSRALAELDEEGVKPSWNAPGFGKITLASPESSYKVVNDGDFAAWAAKLVPAEVTATLTVPIADLDAVMTLLDEQGYADAVTKRLEVRKAWVDHLLDKKKGPVASGDDGEVIYTPNGEPIPGVKEVDGRKPYITRTLDKGAKERVTAALHAFLADRLARGITGAAGPLALLAAVPDDPQEAGSAAACSICGGVYGAPDVTCYPDPDGSDFCGHVDAAKLYADRTGEPVGQVIDMQLEEVPVCRCAHTAGGHRKGVKNYGKCLTPDCPCIRFEEQQ